MFINGKNEPNIRCNRCRFRHPPNRTCAEASRHAAAGRLNVRDVVSLKEDQRIQSPWGTHVISAGQCGTILAHDPSGLMKVSFGDVGTFFVEPANLERMDPAEPANAGIPTHVEINLPAQAVRDLATLAIDVALEAPLDRPSQPGYYCYVNRDTVRSIRAILDDVGIPWKQQKKELGS